MLRTPFRSGSATALKVILASTLVRAHSANLRSVAEAGERERDCFAVIPGTLKKSFFLSSSLSLSLLGEKVGEIPCSLLHEEHDKWRPEPNEYLQHANHFLNVSLSF